MLPHIPAARHPKREFETVVLSMAMKRPVTATFITVVFGAVSLMNMTLDGRLAAFRAVDVVQLIGTGMCFGVALAGLAAILRKRQ